MDNNPDLQRLLIALDTPTRGVVADMRNILGELLGEQREIRRHLSVISENTLLIAQYHQAQREALREVMAAQGVDLPYHTATETGTRVAVDPQVGEPQAPETIPPAVAKEINPDDLDWYVDGGEYWVRENGQARHATSREGRAINAQRGKANTPAAKRVR